MPAAPLPAFRWCRSVRRDSRVASTGGKARVLVKDCPAPLPVSIQKSTSRPPSAGRPSRTSPTQAYCGWLEAFAIGNSFAIAHAEGLEPCSSMISISR
jgi:hypothetical protein